MNPGVFSPPRLLWQEGVLWSLDYADVYHQREGALAESDHVFIQGNDLPRRFSEHREFVLVELGFGTARNFLNTWRHFDGEHLTYIATELHPIDIATLLQLHAGGPLQSWCEKLAAHWPLAVPGVHSLELEARVRLILLWGDSCSMLDRLDLEVHAWYLDGFSPPRNPTMWHEKLCQNIARLSGRDTTLASYSVAAELRRNLDSVGFVCQRRPALGQKRHCLQARYQGSWQTRRAPGYQGPATMPRPRRVVIVGAGLAGCAVAASLRHSLYDGEILLIDARGLAQGASGNPYGLAAIRASDWRQLPDAWRPIAFMHAERSLRHTPWPLVQGHWEAGITPQIPGHEEIFDTVQRAGFFRQRWSASLPPVALCRYWLDDLPLHTYRMVDLRQSSDGGYILYDEHGQSINADAVVLAGGADFDLPAYPLPLRRVAGQVEYAPWSGDDDAWQGDSYALARDGLLLYGASFDAQNLQETPLAADSARNDAALQKLLPDADAAYQRDLRQSRRSLRLMSRDHLPAIGACPDLTQARHLYQDLQHGWRRHHQAPVYPGHLYLSLGHGSHGLSQVNLAATHIVAQMLGHTSPLHLPLQQQIHPLRWTLRELQRRRP